MLRRLVASWLDPKPARPIAPPRSGVGVPVLFEPHRTLVSGGREERRLCLSGVELPVDGAIDWPMGGSDLHAMEYLACLDEAEVVSLVDAWIAEAAESERRGLPTRCVVWMQQISARGRALPRDFVARATSSLAAQLRAVEDGASDLPHAKALLLAGRFFAGSEGERWRKLGLARLEWAIGVSVLEDGVHVERRPDVHLRAFADLLECRAAIDEHSLRPRLDRLLDRMAQAAADLAPPDSAAGCLHAHAALGGRTAWPRPVFAFESAGRFGLRGDESSLLVRGDRTFEWTLGGLPFVVGNESSTPPARIEHVRASEDSLDLRLARDGGPWTLRATPERIGIEDEVVERTSDPVRTRLRLHPEVELELSPDARTIELRRKGIRAIVDGPNPMRVVPTSAGVEIVVHHGIAPCSGELSLRHVPATSGDDVLDSLPGIAGRLPRAHDQSVLDLVQVRPV